MTHFSYTVNQEVWVYPEHRKGLVEMRRKVSGKREDYDNFYIVSFSDGVSEEAGWYSERSLEPYSQVSLRI